VAGKQIRRLAWTTGPCPEPDESSPVSLTFVSINPLIYASGSPLWSSGQSSWLRIQRSRVRLPALPDFLRSSESVTGSTQPREELLNGKIASPGLENRNYRL
jgi:hypothetical protein